MSKFNVGDRVKVVGRRSSSGEGLRGKIGTVISTDKGWCHLDIEVGFRSGLWDEELELVEEPINVFKIGVRVRLECYAEYKDHENHDGQFATIIAVRETLIEVKWEDGTFSTVPFDCKANPYIVNNELKNNKMDVSDIAKLDKGIVKDAKKNVLKKRKESQTEQAEAVLTELFNVKDTVEEKIGEDQAILNSVNEDIAVFDVK